MAMYYVNKNAQSNGDHEVHNSDCNYLPESQNLLRLGDFSTCRPAVEEAKKYYDQCNGCAYCTAACHTQ